MGGFLGFAIATIIILTIIVVKADPNPAGIIDWFKPKGLQNDHDSAYHSGNELNSTPKSDDPLKEHGQLEYGRELVKGFGDTISKIGEKVGITPTSSTKGLDTDKEKGFLGGAADKVKSYIRAIYPGTVWCGDGDIAKSIHDLGFFQETDKCCREHDSCNDTIAVGETRDGLENSGLFTRSHCNCDKKFHDCLKTAGTLISMKIGTAYFTGLGPQCYKMEYPITGCKSTSSWKRCSEYEVDTLKPQRLQWFDNPAF